jgi:hypothetical protein
MRTTTPIPTTPLTSGFLAALAGDIAELGIRHESIAARLAAAVEAGRRHTGAAVLVALVADPQAPAVARERAFGRLAALLAKPRPATPPRQPVAA